jgi:hypothetical protein
MSMTQALKLLEEENRKFEGHWLWRELGCRPQEFFQAFERHLSALQIPRDRWDRALERAKAASEAHVKEKQTQQSFDPPLMQHGLRV